MGTGIIVRSIHVTEGPDFQMEIPPGIYLLHARHFDLWVSNSLEGLQLIQAMPQGGALSVELPLVAPPAPSPSLFGEFSLAGIPEESPTLSTDRIALIPSSSTWPVAPPGRVALGQLVEAFAEARLLHEIVNRSAGALGGVNRDPRFFQVYEEAGTLLGPTAVPAGKLVGATVLIQPAVHVWEGIIFMYVEGASTFDGLVRAAAFDHAPAPAISGTSSDIKLALGRLALRTRESLLNPLPPKGLPTLERASPQLYQDAVALSPMLVAAAILDQAATAEAIDSQRDWVRLSASSDLLEATITEHVFQRSVLVDENTAVPVGNLDPIDLLMLPAASGGTAGFGGMALHLDILSIETGAYLSAVTWNVPASPTSVRASIQDIALEAFAQAVRDDASQEATEGGPTTLFVTLAILFGEPFQDEPGRKDALARGFQRTALTTLVQEFPNRIQVVPRDTAIDLILETWDLNMSELVDETTAPPVHKLLPADVALVPFRWEEPGQALMGLQAVDANLGEVLWATQDPGNLSLADMTREYAATLLDGEIPEAASSGSMLTVQVDVGVEGTPANAPAHAIISALMTGAPQTVDGPGMRVHVEPASFWERSDATPILPEFQLEADIRGELSVSSAPSHGFPLGDLIREYGSEAVVPDFVLQVNLDSYPYSERDATRPWQVCWTLQDRVTGESSGGAEAHFREGVSVALRGNPTRSARGSVMERPSPPGPDRGACILV